MKPKAGALLEQLKQRAESQITAAVKILFAKGQARPFSYTDEYGHRREIQIVNSYGVYTIDENGDTRYWNASRHKWCHLCNDNDILEMAHDADYLLTKARSL